MVIPLKVGFFPVVKYPDRIMIGPVNTVLLLADSQIYHGMAARLYQLVMGEGDGYRALGAALEAAKAKIFTLLFHLAGLY